MKDPFIAFQSGDPADTRFQFEIIKNLADSVRQMAAQMGDMQKTQVSMLERLATLEAGKVTHRLDDLDKKVDSLEKDRNRRDGALGALGALRVWGPALFGLFTALYLLGRAVGVIPSPPTTVTKIETPAVTDQRRQMQSEQQPTDTPTGGTP